MSKRFVTWDHDHYNGVEYSFEGKFDGLVKSHILSHCEERSDEAI